MGVVGDAFLVLCRQIFGDLGSDYQITSQQGSPQEMQISKLSNFVLLFISWFLSALQHEFNVFKG